MAKKSVKKLSEPVHDEPLKCPVCKAPMTIVKWSDRQAVLCSKNLAGTESCGKTFQLSDEYKKKLLKQDRELAKAARLKMLAVATACRHIQLHALPAKDKRGEVWPPSPSLYTIANRPGLFVRRALKDEGIEAVLNGARRKFRRWEAAEKEAIEAAGEFCGATECLQMVGEVLEAQGIDLKSTPPMNYNDAIQSVIFDKLKEAGAFPGHPATVRYERVPDTEEERYRAVPLEAVDSSNLTKKT